MKVLISHDLIKFFRVAGGGRFFKEKKRKGETFAKIGILFQMGRMLQVSEICVS